MSDPAPHLPLSRFKVLDITRARAGPTAVRHLADWGAQVIRIEQPSESEDADPAAGARHGFDFQNLHRNKRAMTLDLKSEAGKAIFMELVKEADVILENMRAQVKFRLGIDYESVRKVNPGIVYGSISGFGQDGPYGPRPGVDQIAQGMGGLMSITGLPGQGPVRVGIPIADLTAGGFLAQGVLIALLDREVSGVGRWVTTSLLEAQIAMLDFQAARWLIADEVYIRLAYETDLPHGRAPSFLDIAKADDRLIVINSFSKSWSMTGWRLGWITHPVDCGEAFEKLVEYNIANPTTFVQYAGVFAIRDGEDFVTETVERYRRNRDIVVQRLGAMKRVTLSRPEGAFYAFFAVDGMTDSVAFAQKLIDDVGVGLAPGRAFSEDGEGWMRLCFAADTATVSAAMDRLDPVLG